VGEKGWLSSKIRPAGDPTNRPTLPARFPGRLNRRLTGALAVILGMVLLVGGVTLFLAVQLFRNDETILIGQARRMEALTGEMSASHRTTGIR